MAQMTIPALGKKHHLAETTVRDAIKAEAFPAQKMGRDYIVDDEHPDFLRWKEDHQQQSRVKGERRKAVPLLALGEYAARNGVVLSRQREGYDIEQPLVVMLEIAEKEGLDPDLARAATKGGIEQLLQGKVPRPVIEQYVDLFYDTVLGEPFWNNLLSFLQRERMMKAAYVQAFRETQINDEELIGYSDRNATWGSSPCCKPDTRGRENE